MKNSNHVLNVDDVLETSKRLQDGIQYIENARGHGSWFIPPIV